MDKSTWLPMALDMSCHSAVSQEGNRFTFTTAHTPDEIVAVVERAGTRLLRINRADDPTREVPGGEPVSFLGGEPPIILYGPGIVVGLTPVTDYVWGVSAVLIPPTVERSFGANRGTKKRRVVVVTP